MVLLSRATGKFRADMTQRLTIALLAATLSVPLASAQMRGGVGRAFSGGHSGLANGVGGGVGHHGRTDHIRIDHGRTGRFARGINGGFPFFYSDDFGDEYLADNSVESAPPQVVLVRSAPDDSRRVKPGPLVIERQGNRYVRYGGAEEMKDGKSAHPDYAEPTIGIVPTNPPILSAKKGRDESAAGAMPPALLVYQDGHREEISYYAIADGVIYVRGNYWRDGYWTKHILLSALDAAATLDANQQRGVKFILPSASNVVIASF
jgi:hypothetical protein